jgi:hypothetical protein
MNALDLTSGSAGMTALFMGTRAALGLLLVRTEPTGPLQHVRARLVRPRDHRDILAAPDTLACVFRNEVARHFERRVKGLWIAVAALMLIGQAGIGMLLWWLRDLQKAPLGVCTFPSGDSRRPGCRAYGLNR